MFCHTAAYYIQRKALSDSQIPTMASVEVIDTGETLCCNPESTDTRSYIFKFSKDNLSKPENWKPVETSDPEASHRE